jgi:hypothetical protein
VSKPSLNLLTELDNELAVKFKEFALFIGSYGCYPHHDEINPKILSEIDIQLLIETGFIVRSTNSIFKFRDFSLSLGFAPLDGLASGFMHDNLLLSQRASAIANALLGGRSYAENVGREFDQDKFVDTYVRITQAAFKVGPAPVGLVFTNVTDNKRTVIRIKDGSSRISFESILTELKANNITLSPAMDQFLKLITAMMPIFGVQNQVVDPHILN